MRKQYFAVKDITKITGISRRTLHYYDEIGLLKPSSLSSSGHRLYDIHDFEKLQLILFLKEMDLPLKEIATILNMPSQEQDEVLRYHRELLSRKKLKLEKIMLNLDLYLTGVDISELDLFDEGNVFSLKEQYRLEAQFAYGETDKYKAYMSKLSQLTSEEKEKTFTKFEDEMKRLFVSFSAYVKEQPSSEKVQAIVKQWVACFESLFKCDKEILICISRTYKFDNRFKRHINQYSDSDEDLSDFIYRAIMHYCDSK